MPDKVERLTARYLSYYRRIITKVTIGPVYDRLVAEFSYKFGLVNSEATALLHSRDPLEYFAMYEDSHQEPASIPHVVDYEDLPADYVGPFVWVGMKYTIGWERLANGDIIRRAGD